MNKCEFEVTYKLNFYRTRHCKNNATVYKNGKHYCSIHDPDKVALRDKAKEERRKEKDNLKRLLYLNKFRKVR
jgi:hypothetical protein